jgi:hypothetical protein
MVRTKTFEIKYHLTVIELLSRESIKKPWEMLRRLGRTGL